MKLVLGTAQFGLPYGITNAGGQVSVEEVSRILALAELRGIRLLDTAAQYGDSEQVLGAKLRPSWNVSLVTKTPSFKGERIVESQARQLEATFDESLKRLKRAKIYGLMIHHAADLLAHGGHLLLDAMLRLKDAGLVEKLGVSVYAAGEIDAIFAKFDHIDLVQLPLSIVDQRLAATGHLKHLKRQGVEIHARSIFLQGLLLTSPDAVPPRLQELQPFVADLKAYAASHGLTPVGAALGFIDGLNEVDRGIIGVCSAKELDSIFSLRKPLPANFDVGRFACDREELVNPARWQ